MLIKICSIKINPPLQPKRGRGILLLFRLNKKIAHALIFFVSELTTVDGILIPTVPQNNISVHKVSVINLSSSLLSWDEGGKTRYPVTSCFLYTTRLSLFRRTIIQQLNEFIVANWSSAFLSWSKGGKTRYPVTSSYNNVQCHVSRKDASRAHDFKFVSQILK